jgi:hypothetical protein
MVSKLYPNAPFGKRYPVYPTIGRLVPFPDIGHKKKAELPGNSAYEKSIG